MQHNTNEQQTEPDETLVLPSAGYDYQFATRHKFVRVEQVDLSTLKYANKPRSDRPANALIYQCEETGAERRWGLE